MLEFNQAQLKGLAVHLIGNKHLEEGVSTSSKLHPVNLELEEVLKDYFLTAFKGEETWKLDHPTNLTNNIVYHCSSWIFQDPELLYLNSVKLLNHLYDQSDHPHIKSGELFIAHFEDCVLEGELVEAIGIFKAETKSNFLQLNHEQEGYEIKVQEGIATGKLDKGCLIFNTEKDSGFRVMVVDNNKYDTHYWNNYFLGLKPDQNENYFTKSTMSLVSDFAREVVAPKEDQREQAVFLNRSREYFDQSEKFDLQEFSQQVLEVPEIIEEFKSYKRNFEEEKDIPTLDDFDIAPQALKTMRNKLKSDIRLDTNIQIKLNFNDPQTSKQFIDKGYDENKGMYYYKVYFNFEKE